MTGETDEVKVKVTGDSVGAQEAMRGAANSVRAGVGQIKTQFDSLSGVGSKIVGIFAAVGVALAGGKLFKDAVDETVNLTKESVALGRQFGETATTASIMKVALDDVFVKEELLTAAGNRITQTLRTNEEAFGDLGVKVRDSSGHLRSTFSIMMDVNKHLRDFKEGTDRNIEGQKIYSRGWAQIAPVLKLTEEAMESANEKARSLGLVVGEESVEATQKYRSAMNDVHDVVQGLKKAVGDALLPSLTAMGEWFASMGPTAVNVMRGAMVGLIIAFETLTVIVSTAWTILKAGVQQIVQLFLTLADVGSKALKFDFRGAKQAWEDGWDGIVDIGARAVNDIDATVKASTDRVSAAMSRAFVPETAIQKKPNAASATSSGGTKTGNDERFRMMVNELEKEKIARGQFRQEDLTGDLSYWEEKLAVTGTKTAADKTLRVKIEHEIFGIKKQIAAQERALAEEEISTAEALAQEEVAMKRDALDARLEMSGLTIRQELTAYRQLEREKYNIERDALLARLKLVDGDALARRRIQNQLLIAEKQHIGSMNRMEQDASLQTQRYWTSIMQPISNSITQSVQGMVLGTTKLKDALFNIGKSILDQFVQMQAEKLTRYLAVEAAHTAAAVTGAETRAVAEEVSAKRGIIANILAGLKMIAINAVKVISAVWSAIAGIPYVGPFLAPVMAVAAGAAVAGLASRITSARGGYDIPSGVNPITQLHEDEMVLPARQADVIRRMANGEGGGGGATINNHWTVQALDGNSVVKILSKHGREIAGILASQSRSFNPAIS